MNKLKSLLPTKTTYNDFAQSLHKNTTEKLEPEIGFRLTLDSGKAKNSKEKDRPPELIVHLIGARHLPTTFGLKSVQGYQVKVKLFPGGTKYDSNIQTTSWPKFNQSFKFPLQPLQKSSMKQKKGVTNVEQPLPEMLFNGHFIVFTMFALLELPPEATSSIQEAYSAFKRQGSLLLRQRPSNLLKTGSLNEDEVNKKAKEKSKGDKLTESDSKSKKNTSTVLTASESQRNLGSVTWFFEPKLFIEDPKTNTFATDEMWKSIKEFTAKYVTDSRISVQSSGKGQIEIILELVECEPVMTPTTPSHVPGNPFDEEDVVADASKSSTRAKRLSFKGIKSMIKIKKDKPKSLCLKITTSRMRCSIKAKEGFEQKTSDMYIKTSVFQHDMHVKSWKSDNFAPTLSCRWDPNEATMTLPLREENDLEYMNVRISIATKNKLGKKLVFGELNLGPRAKGTLLEHWSNMIYGRGSPVAMWHSFE